MEMLYCFRARETFQICGKHELHQRIVEEEVRSSVNMLMLKCIWFMKKDNDPKHKSKSTSE